jgi:uncharacterized protein (TIGR03083 family)
VTAGAADTFVSAARAFAGLVRALPDSAWDGPGLGDWDLRSLVGHASRSLTTVSTYLQNPAAREDIASPQDYYAYARTLASTLGGAAIVERGRQAGRDLGDDPAAAVDGLLERVIEDLAGREDPLEDPLIEVIGGRGIRLSCYLPTRTFELAVHSLDIARSSGVEFGLPVDVLRDAATLAAGISVTLGDGESVLLALTGRTALPEGFSVV